MQWFRIITKSIRRLAWAFVVAYMIAWHNVYKQKTDNVNNIEFHMENNHEDESGETIS